MKIENNFNKKCAVKRIYLEGRVSGWNLHSLYNELTRYPPEGYEFMTDGQTEASSHADPYHLIDKKLIKLGLLKDISDYFRPWFYYSYYLAKKKPLPKKIDLIFSCGHIVFRKMPWVVDLEHVGSLVAYGFHFGLFKNVLERMLSSRYCKRIMPWSEVGKETLLANLNCKGFDEKIEVVHLAVHPKDFIKKYSKDKIKLLFVGTGNPFNIPDSFELKGGKVVLKAFKHLNEKYDSLELVIKSYIPPEIKKECDLFPNIRVIDKTLPWSLLEQEFKTADIFLHPGYFTPGMVILDAMSYELPVITTNLWGNPEIIDDGKTGFLISEPAGIPYYSENLLPKEGTRDVLKAIKIVDPKLVRELVEKTSILIEDEKLRRKMGRNARKEIQTGKFSIRTRNQKLKRIFDEAIED